MIKPFIITLTGSSSCGKSYVAQKIIDLKKDPYFARLGFEVEQIQKYSTRTYREKEVRALRERSKGVKTDKNFVDIISEERIPDECDFIYLSYGKYYGVTAKMLKSILDNGKCPVVVVNDITTLYNLKSIFKGQIVSLYVFRNMLTLRDMLKEARERGNSPRKEVKDRYEKANTLHMNFLANVELFDRVILNVRDYTEEDVLTGALDLTGIQIRNVIKAVLNGKLDLSGEKVYGNKLFVISGNAQSGKDDVIQGVRKMGKLLSAIVPKYTSRAQERDDGDEMICKYVPQKSIYELFEKAYELRREKIEKKYRQQDPEKPHYPESFNKFCEKNFNKKSNDTLEDYKAVKWEVKRINSIRRLKTPVIRFFSAVAKAIEAGEDDATEEFFQLNPDYVDLDDMREKNDIVVRPQLSDQYPDEGPAYVIPFDNTEYIIYENNKKSDGSKYKYGFTLESVKNSLKNKHVLLVSSLMKTLDICREKFGKKNIVTVFAYSQIDKETYGKYNNSEQAKAKMQEYDDIKRYADNIADFDHVLIYTESGYVDKSNGLKETLIEQMFKLFRLYSSGR